MDQANPAAPAAVTTASDPAERDEIRRKVVAAVARALDLDPSAVSPGASLEADLGAESLDLLDLAFMLEREFQVRLPRQNLLQRAEEATGPGTLIRDGAVTEQGIAMLRQRMPEVDPARLRAGLPVAELGRLVTVETFVRLVEQLLAHKRALLAEPCACGGRRTASDTAPELVCAGCGNRLPLPPGDEALLAAHGARPAGA